jgi:hypothetical protein
VKKKILRGKKRETIERMKGGKEKKRKKCEEKAKRRKKLHLEGVGPKLPASFPKLSNKLFFSVKDVGRGGWTNCILFSHLTHLRLSANKCF